jgi:hypothetical protein
MGFLSSLFGVKDRTPATSTNVVSQKLPPEIAPAVKRAVDEATAIFEAEKAIELGQKSLHPKLHKSICLHTKEP